jgi:hypothetical protein
MYKPGRGGRKGESSSNDGSYLPNSRLSVSWLGRGDDQTALAISTVKILAQEIDSRTSPRRDIVWLRELPALWEENLPGEIPPNKAWMWISVFLKLPY